MPVPVLPSEKKRQFQSNLARMSSDEGEKTSSPRSPAAPPLDDDDLLSEILLRLPPQPSSLPRASAVAKRWRSLTSDPRFCSRFRSHHRRNPPLLGCFVKFFDDIYFNYTLDAPNRVPRGRFSVPIHAGESFRPLGCRHGLVLILSSGNQLLVWDPITGDQHRLDIPPVFDTENRWISAAVLRPAGDIQHFQVVLVGHSDMHHQKAVASVYSSETGVWGNLITVQLPPDDPRVIQYKPAVMVGDSLYWLITGDIFRILEFDLGRRSLSLMPIPGEEIHWWEGVGDISVVLLEDGGLGFLILSKFSAQLWKRKINCDGVTLWLVEKTIALDRLLSNSEWATPRPFILGFAENNNVLLFRTAAGVFTVQLESFQFKKVFDYNNWHGFYPFEVVYTAGI
ncbi:hypothetical protein ACQ4PT_068817 [Festuca glaucescens]